MTRVEVLSVQKLTDIVTGHIAVQVIFGDVVPANDAMRERFSNVDQPPPVGDEAAHQVLSVLFPPAEVEPYQVGSKWELDRSESGELRLRKLK